MGGHILVGRIQIGVVTMRERDTGFKIIRHDDVWHAANDYRM